MFGIFKRKPKPQPDIYRVRYVLGATIDPSAGKAGAVTFELQYLKETYVKAFSLLDAQAVFASKHMLTPHVYVHDICKVDLISRDTSLTGIFLS